VLEYLSIDMSLIDGDSERATYKWADRVQAIWDDQWSI